MFNKAVESFLSDIVEGTEYENMCVLSDEDSDKWFRLLIDSYSDRDQNGRSYKAKDADIPTGILDFMGDSSDKYWENKKKEWRERGMYNDRADKRVFHALKVVIGHKIHMAGSIVKYAEDKNPNASAFTHAVLDIVNTPVDLLFKGIGKGYDGAKRLLLNEGSRTERFIARIENNILERLSEFAPSEEQAAFFNALEIAGIGKIAHIASKKITHNIVSKHYDNNVAKNLVDDVDGKTYLDRDINIKKYEINDHIRDRHMAAVGESVDDKTMKRFNELVKRKPNKPDIASSVFKNENIVPKVIERCIEQNKKQIDEWAKHAKISKTMGFNIDMKETIGRGIEKGDSKITDWTKAIVVLKKTENGYDFFTAYPVKKFRK